MNRLRIIFLTGCFYFLRDMWKLTKKRDNFTHASATLRSVIEYWAWKILIIKWNMQEWMLLKRTSHGMKCIIIIMHDGSINIRKNHHYRRQRWQRRKKHLKLMQKVKMGGGRRRNDKNMQKNIFHSCKIEHVSEWHWRFISWMNEMATNIHEWINLCWYSYWISYRVMGNFHNFVFPCDFIYLQFLNHICIKLHAKLHSKIFA